MDRIEVPCGGCSTDPCYHWPYCTELLTLRTENQRLRADINKGCKLINEMDLRMPEQATEDADGWIVSYRIPVGPWHRILGWARGGHPT